VIVAPLLIHGELRGALALVSSSASRRYGASDVRLVEELAARAALAIENARLYRVATRALKAREDVLKIVAHDLRNPLSTILTQGSLLRRPGGGPDRRSRQPALVIERAANRMNRIIQDLLDVTRMEAGRLSIERNRLPAAQVILDSLENEKTLAASASIDLRADVAPGLPDVWGDRHRLMQVFENLIGNALKFTARGGRVTVGAAPRAGDVLFWVADTGAGISAEDLPHVFDEFWQAAHAKRLGAGLGLPIVKGIIEAHDGRVWVESTPGRGSIFFFTIPSVAAAAESRPRTSWA
jgi:signal transduction histidine kinase